MSNDVKFWPIRRTAVRSLRRGDMIHARLGPNTLVLAKVTDFEDHEKSKIIAVQVEFGNGESGVKKCRPWEMVDRMVQPGEPPQGTESILVRGDEMWKWLGAPMNDPDGTAEKYTLKTFRRIESDEIEAEAIELKMQSVWNTEKIFTMIMSRSGTIGFEGHR